jgi:GT2 family glycosyltransferase
MEKVLVASPVYEGMDYCIDEFIESIKELDYDSYDILLYDNSITPEFSKDLVKKGINVLTLDSSEENKLKRLVLTRNKILQYAMNNSYDYLLMLDCDVIPPRETIKRLLSQEKDIISGLYHNFFKVSGELKRRPVCWRALTDKEFEIIKKQYNLPNLVQSKENIRRFLTPKEEESKEVLQVMIASAGCMLLSKKAFSALSYGILDIPEGMHTSDDIYFFRKARENNFEIFCDTSLVCKHLIEGKFKESSNHPVYE